MAENEIKDQKRKSNLWIVVAVLFGLFAIGGVVLLLLVGAVVGAVAGAVPESAPSFYKKTLEGSGSSEILVLPIKGVITEESGLTMRGGMNINHIKARLKKAGKDPKVKGIVLWVNSPGGAITATDKIYQHMVEFKNEFKKPMVAYLDSVAASGGYYLAAGCDEIVSHPTCITGSIGVIMTLLNIQELFEKKLGIRELVIKSGPHKDIGSMYRPMSDEEKKILEDMIQEMYRRFLEVVKKGRPKLATLKDSDWLKIADGKIYTGVQAHALGLVDHIGSFEKSVERVCEMANVDKQNYRVVQYEESKSLLQELLQSSTKTGSPEEKIMEHFLGRLGMPHFYYLWRTP